MLVNLTQLFVELNNLIIQIVMLYTFHFGCSEMIQQACRKRPGGLNIGQTADKKGKELLLKSEQGIFFEI